MKNNEDSKSIIANITVDPGRLKEIEQVIELLGEVADIFRTQLDTKKVDERQILEWNDKLGKIFNFEDEV